jgi:hypothetical protein
MNQRDFLTYHLFKGFTELADDALTHFLARLVCQVEV